jgi:hypothetical protein
MLTSGGGFNKISTSTYTTRYDIQVAIVAMLNTQIRIKMIYDICSIELQLGYIITMVYLPLVASFLVHRLVWREGQG